MQMRRLSSVADDAVITALAPQFSNQADAYEVNTARRVRLFMAQVAHESGGFSALVENLQYKPERLMAVWPSRFPDLATANQYAHQPQKLANFVYGGRMGNVGGNDGWNYRGRSPIMLTGREGYTAMEAITGLPLISDPDLAALPIHGARIALAWWKHHGLNEIADADAGELVYATAKETFMRDEADDMQALRLRINGGFNGLQDAMNYGIRAQDIWPDEA
jgi:putative chitinase